MGSRMLSSMTQHRSFNVLQAWDMNKATIQRALSDHPNISVPENAEDMIHKPGIDLIYIATPPSTHVKYAEMAVECGKAVLCEKPLGIDINDSRRLTSLIKRKPCPNMVNFGFATGPLINYLDESLMSRELGDLVGINIQFHFAKWPRNWQQAGDWLTQRYEGGFVREVFSHFAYLTHRTVGPLKLEFAKVDYPMNPILAEVRVLAKLQSGNLPVHLSGTVGGTAPEKLEWTLYGTDQSFRIKNWNNLQQSSRDSWVNVPLDSSRELSQLDAIGKVIDGQHSVLPDFEAGLIIQNIVEEILMN